MNGSGLMEPRSFAMAPEGEGCPRCGGCVYAAEQMLARGKVRHLFIFYINVKFIIVKNFKNIIY